MSTIFDILIVGVLVICVILAAVGVVFHQIAMREQNASKDGDTE